MTPSKPSAEAVFTALREVLAVCAGRCTVKIDTPGEYLLDTRSPSPFPQHKGQPMFFGMVKSGKAYVSFHLMPLYMCPPLQARITPNLKKRMQGKTCFNFKAMPDADLLADLRALTTACLAAWDDRGWL